MNKLHISNDLALPLDAITEKRIIVGSSGSGKTTTAIDLMEEMLKAGLQVVAIDVKDELWGLRSGADGKSEGYPITILGGIHADAPLEYTAGKVIGEWIVQEHASLILSISQFSDGQRYRFMYDLLGYLIRRDSATATPLALIIDEAHNIMPQEKQTKIMKDAEVQGRLVSESMMLSLARRVTSEGRSKGIGLTLTTQSPALIDKRVMNLCPVIIAHRTFGKNDFAAVQDWFKVWVRTKEQMDIVMTKLPTLKKGEAIYYAPNEDEDGIFDINQGGIAGITRPWLTSQGAIFNIILIIRRFFYG